MVELAGLRARNEPWPVHRHALQWRRCIEGPTFLETKRRAVALRDLTGARVVERAAIALALLDELEAICEPRARGFAPMYEPRARGFAPMNMWSGGVLVGTCIPDFDRLVGRARDDLVAVLVEGN